MSRAAFLLALALVAPAARAQDEEPGQARIPEPAPELSPDALEPPPAETATTAARPCSEEAERIYDDGFQRLARGDRAGGAAAMQRVLDRCPEHRFAAELLRLANMELEGGGVLVRRRAPEKPPLRLSQPAPPPSPSAEAPSLLSRGELVTIQTLNGMALGLIFCASLECKDGRATVGSALLGGGLGFGLSFFLSKDVRPGQAQAINAGMTWGYWNGVAVAIATDTNDTVAEMVMSFALAGTGLGIAVSALGAPSAGRVSLANSTGLWAGVLTFWILNAAIDDAIQDATTFSVELVASNAGLVAGVLLGRYLPYSRGHVLLIDAGGILGMLLGVGVSFLIDETPERGLVGGLAFGGTLVGLSTVSFLTRHVDDPDPEASPQLTILPLGPKGTLGLSFGGSF